MNRIPFPGNVLREKRQELDLTLDEVYKKLRIPATILAAFEEGRTQDLPPMTYSLGFLRTYCQLLELDPERYADALRESSRPVTNFFGLPSGVDRNLRPAWVNDVTAWAVITLILALGWLTYSITVQPKPEESSGRAQAETILFADTP